MSPQDERKKTATDKLRAYHEEETIARGYDLQYVRRLWPYLRPHTTYVVLSLITLGVLTAIGLIRPLVMGDVVTQAARQNGDLLFRDGVALAGLLLATQVLTFVQMYTMQLAGARAMAALRTDIFGFMQRLSLRYFDHTPIGRLVTRATNDVDAIGEIFATGVINALGDLVALIGIVVMMLALDWRMSLIAFATIPVVALLVNMTRHRSRKAYRDIRVKTARLNAFLNEQVSGIAIVQAFNREESMGREFGEINEAYREANKRAIFYEAVLDAAIEMVGTLCIASVLYWAGLERLMLSLGDGHVSFALVVTFTQYIKQFFEPISMLAQRYTLLQSGLSGAERIFELLDEKEIESPHAQPIATPSHVPTNEAIAFEDVSFEYKANAPVLSNVSFSAERGEHIAIVGATGAGKSTVASLLLRLYDASSGSIRVLGKDVRAYELSELRRLFSVVPQDVFLFRGSVASNVAMSHRVVDAARVAWALERVGAIDMVLRREGGLNAPVDERGSNFSAGERQLLAFARALYKDAPLLLLDEATASIDSDTEAKLQNALEALIEKRTAIVIAHRLSTIQAADRIIVFHKGRLVESGTHQQLLEQGGVYARLYKLQFAQKHVEEATAQESL